MEEYRCEVFREYQLEGLKSKINQWLMKNPSATPINIANGYEGTLRDGAYNAIILYKI